MAADRFGAFRVLVAPACALGLAGMALSLHPVVQLTTGVLIGAPGRLRAVIYGVIGPDRGRAPFWAMGVAACGRLLRPVPHGAGGRLLIAGWAGRTLVLAVAVRWSRR